ncbi:flagellar biosynthetic protein FliO [Luteimonas sp. SDU101]|uniref:flagellar biosynthetic protein FliO n=1 Tax=unclassified Luteimonas TaxID=2629088 RepID=UPI003EBD0FBA
MPPSPRHALPLLLSCLLAALSPGSAAAVVAPEPAGTSYVWELLAIVLPLAFIIVCLLVLLRVLRRRFGLAGPDAPLSVVQVLPVGPRERIVVLRSRAGRAFAVGVSAGAVTLISDLDREDLGPAADGSPPQQTAPPSLLQRYRVKRP